MMRPTILRILVISTLAALSACGPSQKDLDDANSRAEELAAKLEAEAEQRRALEERIAALDGQNDELVNRLRALGENVSTLEGEKSTLASNLDETRRALEELRTRERQAQERLAAYRAIMERFRSMIDSGRLRVRVVRNRLVVELPSGILFPSGSDKLVKGDVAVETLAEVASVLREIGDREFQIAGHTDNIPVSGRAFANNWDLSLQRARTVLQKLIDLGVPPERLSAAGHGDTAPVASNDTDEGRQQNRRIEIVLMPNLDELPDLSALGAE